MSRFLALAALLICTFAFGQEIRSSAGARNFRFSYTTTIPAPPEGTRHLDIWVPLPMQDPGIQGVADLVTSVDGDPDRGRITVDPVYGNTMLYVRIAAPKTWTVVSWTARITRHPDMGQGALPSVARYLEPSRLIPVDGAALSLARKLGVDSVETPTAVRALTIYDDVLQGMDYDKSVPGFGKGDFARAITVCKGNCTDFHARFIGTARAGGIPCRFTMGIPLKSKSAGTYDSYHCWAHWYDGQGWKPVDISEADKIVATDPAGARRFFGQLDPDRIALSFGRDITLEPPQKAGALNYFVFPYAEADGTPLKLDKSMWKFSYRNLGEQP